VSDYTTRALATDAASLDAYSALLGVTSAPTPADYLRWLYADNPWGAAVGSNAYAGDALADLRVSARRRSGLGGGKVVIGGLGH